MELDSTSLDNALVMLGQRLAQLKQHYEVVAIGGGSLVLLGYIDRSTGDLDLVAAIESRRLVSANPLPQGLLKEIAAIGNALELGSMEGLLHYWKPDFPQALRRSL